MARSGQSDHDDAGYRDGDDGQGGYDDAGVVRGSAADIAPPESAAGILAVGTAGDARGRLLGIRGPAGDAAGAGAAAAGCRADCRAARLGRRPRVRRSAGGGARALRPVQQVRLAAVARSVAGLGYQLDTRGGHPGASGGPGRAAREYPRGGFPAQPRPSGRGGQVVLPQRPPVASAQPAFTPAAPATSAAPPPGAFAALAPGAFAAQAPGAFAAQAPDTFAAQAPGAFAGMPLGAPTMADAQAPTRPDAPPLPARPRPGDGAEPDELYRAWQGSVRQASGRPRTAGRRRHTWQVVRVGVPAAVIVTVGAGAVMMLTGKTGEMLAERGDQGTPNAGTGAAATGALPRVSGPARHRDGQLHGRGWRDAARRGQRRRPPRYLAPRRRRHVDAGVGVVARRVPAAGHRGPHRRCLRPGRLDSHRRASASRSSRSSSPPPTA